MATFWRTFRHDGKIRPAWWGWGGFTAGRPPPITSKVVVYAPAERAETLTLFLLYSYSVGDGVADYAQQLYVVSCLLGLRIFCFLFIFEDIYTSDYEKVYV
jgi:hypothetical protein